MRLNLSDEQIIKVYRQPTWATLLIAEWTKSCGATIQKNPFCKYFHMALFVFQHVTK